MKKERAKNEVGTKNGNHGHGASSRIILTRVKNFEGRVRPPGSKSIANRALLLAALARGQTELHNLPASEDVQILIRALGSLGVSISNARTTALRIEGCGGAFEATEVRLNLENAGTAFRPLSAILAASKGRYILDGNEQMRRRPIGDLRRALEELGADISCASGETPPVILNARGLKGGRTRVSGRVSSQFVSALLMIGPLMTENDLEIELPEEPVSRPYIDLTLAMMKDFGVLVERDGYKNFRIPRGDYISPGRYEIESDATAATYFLAAGSISGCGPVRVEGISRESRQGDVAFARMLEEMGATVEYGDDYIETRGTSSGLSAMDADMNSMPDAAMTLAVLSLFCHGETHIRNIENLRVKESERISGIHNELIKLGAGVIEEQDALHISPVRNLQRSVIETYRDHRMAMAFSLASYGVEIEIEDPSCVNKTYPGFFSDFETICIR